MKELFIKCPSCGVVLGVKNSKNETVKKITCPQCKKSLAVSFEEEKQPSTAVPQPLGTLYYGEMPIALQEGVNNTRFPGSDKISLNVVRLTDGGSKCIVQPLMADGSIKINGEVLQADDKVVMAKGDKLEIGHIVLTYDNPYSLPVEKPQREPKVEKKDRKVIPSEPQPQKNNNWLYALVGLFAFAVVAFLLWPKQKVEPQSKPIVDTAMVTIPNTEKETKAPKSNPRKHQKVESDATGRPTGNTRNEKSQYDLEQAALHGDVDAQLELGRQLVKRRESNRIILGLNYLRQASSKGSSEAGRVWHQTVHELQRQATTDSAAYYILMTIDQ